MLENRNSADSRIVAYRPDIDGLRAIAVLSVIVYHLSRGTLPGGYFGVDIFFVLSGYLITAIVWREIGANDFSIARFYDRRIRRIMPALLAMLFATAAASALILLPADLIGFARSLFATLGFVANVYFWRDTHYFSSIADEKPLLHLWSLGIEEQFYLVFPLLLLLLARKAKAWALPVLAGICVASFTLNALALNHDGYLPAFYLLPTRAWELGAGAFIALLPAKAMATPRTMAMGGYVGALLLALSIAAGPRWLPPLLPESTFSVIGAALIVYSGAGVAHPVGRLLSSGGLVFVGLISYSLYLWHWPILVLLKYYLVRDPTMAELGLAVASMLVLAILSWRFIERPFRAVTVTSKTVRHTAVTGVTVLAMAAGAILVRSGFPERLNPAAARINAAVGSHYRCAVSDYLYFEQSRACALELPTRDPKDADVVLFGNSHALMYGPAFRDILRDASLSGLLVPENACLPIYGVNLDPACVELTNRNIDGIAKLKRARVIVLGTNWDSFAARSSQSRPSAEAMKNGLDRTIDHLLSAGKKVVLIGPLATPHWNVASIVSRNLAFGRPTTRPLHGSVQDFQSAYAKIIAHFAQRSDIVFVRPDIVQCASGRCDYVVNGHALFADEHHLAAAALPMFRPALEVAMKQALAIP